MPRQRKSKSPKRSYKRRLPKEVAVSLASVNDDAGDFEPTPFDKIKAADTVLRVARVVCTPSKDHAVDVFTTLAHAAQRAGKAVFLQSWGGKTNAALKADMANIATMFSNMTHEISGECRKVMEARKDQERVAKQNIFKA